MTHPSSQLLSEYLDGTLDPEAEREVVGHLAGCAGCGDLLADLRRVMVRAQALEDLPPREDLWPGVAAAIGAAPARKWRVTIPVPLLLAASVALMLATGVVVAAVLKHQTGTAVLATNPPDRPPTVLPAVDDAKGYDAAVKALTRELDENRSRLDSTTVRIVNQKLELIDRAIGEAERALATDPANNYLHGHLTQTRLRKLDLLRRAAAIGRTVS